MALLVEAPVVAVASLLPRAEEMPEEIPEEIPEIAMERRPGSRRRIAVVAIRMPSARGGSSRNNKGETKSENKRPSASGPKMKGGETRSANADKPRKLGGRRREKRKTIGGVLK